MMISNICCCYSVTQLYPTFETPWIAARQASLSITIPWRLPKLMSVGLVMMLSSHLILSSSCLQSFPASGSFAMRWLFAWSGQSIGASALASVLPMNIQGWFSLGLTGLISLQSKGFSRVFSSTTVHKPQFFSAQPFLLNIYLSNIHWPFALCQGSSSHTNPRRMVLSLPFTLPPQPRGSYSDCSYWILYKVLIQAC